jgi:heat-inducible transcriptional repressor
MEKTTLIDIDQRSREIFRTIVETYLSSGEPAGSRNIAKLLPTRLLPISLSAASVRNVMSDLETLGLLYSPHTSAGRLPTDLGLRFFVDSLLQIGDIEQNDRAQIEAQVAASGKSQSISDILADASQMLSGLSQGAGVVLATKTDKRLKHIEFVRLDPAQALVVLVGEDGSVENRVLKLPIGLPASTLVEAANFLNARLKGRTLGELKLEIDASRKNMESELDEVTTRLIEAGLANWGDPKSDHQQLIVRGQSNLLQDLTAIEDLDRIRLLFADLETQKDVIDLLSRAEIADGVRIYIGSENQRFSFSASSMIAAPFKDSSQKIVGVLGVIGPTRLNYGRIVPVVDYTAKLITRMLETG